MQSIFDDFEIENNDFTALVILPLTRLRIETKFTIGSLTFYPSEYLDLSNLQPHVNNKQVENPINEYCTQLTGISIEDYQYRSLVAFVYNVDFLKLVQNDHSDNIQLIRRLSDFVEPFLQMIKFEFGDFNLFDTLIEKAGCVNDKDYATALIYQFSTGSSQLLAGDLFVSKITKGLGLELNNGNVTYFETCKTVIFLTEFCGEVGNIAKMALMYYAKILEEPNYNTKFILSMNLFEFLSSPEKFEKYKDVKKNIICFNASSNSEYDFISKRFEQFTHIKVEEKETGYRTLIVHYGKHIDELLSFPEQQKLMKEIQRYLSNTIRNLIGNSDKSWSEFIDYRATLKQRFN